MWKLDTFEANVYSQLLDRVRHISKTELHSVRKAGCRHSHIRPFDVATS
jgi:hypothetical protein